MRPFFILVVTFFVVVVPVLLNIAFLTLVERKIMAAIQLRRGPNVIGFGLLQPFADGAKLLLKEFIIPKRVNKRLFLGAPVLFLGSILAIWCLIPYETHVISSPEYSVLAVLTLSSISVYGLIGGGWGSNSRYALLGAVRAAAQLLSYELVLGLIILFVCLEANSFNLIDVVEMQVESWFILPYVWLFPVFLIAVLAETNRTPFDLPEAESELVAGYAVEYSSLPFALYFIGEYGALIVWGHITSIFFFGGWLAPQGFGFGSVVPFAFLELKAIFVYIFFCWVRSTLPRYRWDQLIYLTWRILLPGALALLYGVASLTSIFGIEDLPIDLLFDLPVTPNNASSDWNLLYQSAIMVFSVLYIFFAYMFAGVLCFGVVFAELFFFYRLWRDGAADSYEAQYALMVRRAWLRVYKWLVLVLVIVVYCIVSAEGAAIAYDGNIQGEPVMLKILIPYDMFIEGMDFLGGIPLAQGAEYDVALARYQHKLWEVWAMGAGAFLWKSFYFSILLLLVEDVVCTTRTKDAGRQLRLPLFPVEGGMSDYEKKLRILEAVAYRYKRSSLVAKNIMRRLRGVNEYGHPTQWGRYVIRPLYRIIVVPIRGLMRLVLIKPVWVVVGLVKIIVKFIWWIIRPIFNVFARFRLFRKAVRSLIWAFVWVPWRKLAKIRFHGVLTVFHPEIGTVLWDPKRWIILDPEMMAKKAMAVQDEKEAANRHVRSFTRVEFAVLFLSQSVLFLLMGLWVLFPYSDWPSFGSFLLFFFCITCRFWYFIGYSFWHDANEIDQDSHGHE